MVRKSGPYGIPCAASSPPNVLGRLAEYAGHFRDDFNRPRRAARCVVYLRGLLKDADRKRIEPMARSALPDDPTASGVMARRVRRYDDEGLHGALGHLPPRAAKSAAADDDGSPRRRLATI